MPRPVGTRLDAPRSDSGLARLWQWARGQRKPWSQDDAAEAASLSRSRCRAIVLAMRAAGLVEMVDDRKSLGYRQGWTAPTFRLSAIARKHATPPIMVVEGSAIVGMRFPAPPRARRPA